METPLSALQQDGFDIELRNHASAILSLDFATELSELIAALKTIRIPAAELIASGGGEAASTKRLREVLTTSGWNKHNFRIETLVDGAPVGSAMTHEIDHVRRGESGTLALEIEWNNKDPFFDRDLEAFQRLHARSIISAGIIITRGSAMQANLASIIEGHLRARNITSEDALLSLGMKARTARQQATVADSVAQGADFPAAFARSFAADKFGTATTHWAKLAERVRRGVGNPCPLLLIGLPVSAIEGQGIGPML